jgi:YHS domain-containing protein
MKIQFLGLLTLLCAFSAWAGPGANLDKSGIILQGYDAVSYFQSEGPQKGDPKFQTKLDGATYLFASDANRQEFIKDPKKYAPQFGGWCAYAVADSKSKVDVDPKSFVIQDGRLLLFYNGLWADTRKKWSKDSANFLKKADANWPEVEKKDP